MQVCAAPALEIAQLTWNQRKQLHEPPQETSFNDIVPNESDATEKQSSSAVASLHEMSSSKESVASAFSSAVATRDIHAKMPSESLTLQLDSSNLEVQERADIESPEQSAVSASSTPVDTQHILADNMHYSIQSASSTLTNIERVLSRDTDESAPSNLAKLVSLIDDKETVEFENHKPEAVVPYLSRDRSSAEQDTLADMPVGPDLSKHKDESSEQALSSVADSFSAEGILQVASDLTAPEVQVHSSAAGDASVSDSAAVHPADSVLDEQNGSKEEITISQDSFLAPAMYSSSNVTASSILATAHDETNVVSPATAVREGDNVVDAVFPSSPSAFKEAGDTSIVVPSSPVSHTNPMFSTNNSPNTSLSTPVRLFTLFIFDLLFFDLFYVHYMSTSLNLF